MFVVILSQLEAMQLFSCKINNKIKHKKEKENHNYLLYINLEDHSLSMTCSTRNKILKQLYKIRMCSYLSSKGDT